MIRNKIILSIIVGTILVEISTPIVAKSFQQTNKKLTSNKITSQVSSNEFYIDTTDKTTNYFVDDCAIVSNYDKKIKDEKRKQEIIKERENRINKCEWLYSYDIDPGDLSNSRLDFLAEAYKWLGSNYLYGGETPPRKVNGEWESVENGRGFDCSSFVRYVTCKTKDIDLGRTTFDQLDSPHLQKIDLNKAQAGDLVYNNNREHVGIFLKNNYDGTILMLHDPKTGDKIKIGNYGTDITLYKIN